MPSLQEALALARLVIIGLSAVSSSVVATVLHRKMELLLPSPYATRGGPPRRRGPALPKLFFSVMLTDWFFGCTGAISLSMELVMGHRAKYHNVLGVTMEGVFDASLAATMLWGSVLSVFVLIGNHQPSPSMNEAGQDAKKNAPQKHFRVRTAWMGVWIVAAVYGLLIATYVQAWVLRWPGRHALRTTCLVYISIVYGVSLLLVLVTLGVLLRRRQRLWGRNVPAPIRFSYITNSTSEPTPMLARSLADSRVKQEQVAEARRYELHMKIVQYLLLVLTMQLPYMLSRWFGHETLSVVFIEIGDCLLFSIPLVNTLVFACWKDMGTGQSRTNRNPDDDSNSTMLQSTEGPGGQRSRIANNSLLFGTSLRPGQQPGAGVFGHSSRVGGAFASSYRSLFGSSNNPNPNASGIREKDTAALKGTFIGSGQDQVTLDDLDGLSNLSFIAEGASGSVYKAQWLGIEVAMKIIKLPTTETNGVVDADLYRTFIQNSEISFIEEASLCARLRHPNITLFMRAGFYEGKLAILTEYCARGSLKDVLKRHFPLGWRRKVALALHISKGLTYLHARNPTYIHRDLKASNILVTDTWQAKLADFGISKVANIVNRVAFNERVTLEAPPSSGSAVGAAVQNPSRAGSMIDELTSFAGTWRWNAPEILTDPHNCRYNRATDMYSFGMVLWEIASDGAVPFSDTRFDFEVREKVLVEQRPPINPSQRCPDKFADLIRQCWSQNPLHRPSAPHAAEVLNLILEQMEKDSNDFATSASISASEYTNSIFSSLRGTHDDDTRPSIGARLTNILRGRFSSRSSSKSNMSQDEFQKFTSPYSDSRGSLRDSSVTEKSPASSSLEGSGFGGPILGGSSVTAANGSRRFVRLSSLSEYELGAGHPSDMSTGYSAASIADDEVPSFRDMRIDAMLEESPDDRHENDEVMDVDPDEEMFMDVNGNFHRLSQIKKSSS